MDENTGFTIPEDITALSADDLAAAQVQAQEAAEAIIALGGDATDEQIAQLEALADFTESVDAEVGNREQAAAERQARLDAAAARMQGTDTDEADTDDGDANPDDEGADEDAEADGGAGSEDTGAPAQLAASGRPRSRIRATRQVPNPRPRGTAPTDGMRMSITAAAEVGVPMGSMIPDTLALAEAFIQRSKGFPQGVSRTPGIYQRHTVATIAREFGSNPEALHIGNVGAGKAYQDAQELFQAAAREKALSGGSLVAAGGWCAPSETLYGLCQKETLDGIIDLPTIGVDRGGINFTPGPDFKDIFTGAGFAQTEAQAIAGTSKTCVEVDCPDFSEVRLDAVGLCVKAPLLTRAAYPELVQRWLEGTVIANQHKIAARLITAMRTALGTALAPVLTGTPITWGALTAIELVAEGIRSDYRMGDNDTVEVIIPKWVRVPLRADLANRMGIGKESVTDADVLRHFADRNVALQLVRNYLDLDTSAGPIAFPSTFEAMVYPAGTFVKGTANVISLDTVYDTADLQTNVYTAAFAEDGVLLAKMCHGGKRITLPTCASGMLGAAQLDDCWGTAQAETAGAAPA